MCVGSIHGASATHTACAEPPGQLGVCTWSPSHWSSPWSFQWSLQWLIWQCCNRKPSSTLWEFIKKKQLYLKNWNHKYEGGIAEASLLPNLHLARCSCRTAFRPVLSAPIQSEGHQKYCFSVRAMQLLPYLFVSDFWFNCISSLLFRSVARYKNGRCWRSHVSSTGRLGR